MNTRNDTSKMAVPWYYGHNTLFPGNERTESPTMSFSQRSLDEPAINIPSSSVSRASFTSRRSFLSNISSGILAKVIKLKSSNQQNNDEVASILDEIYDSYLQPNSSLSPPTLFSPASQINTGNSSVSVLNFSKKFTTLSVNPTSTLQLGIGGHLNSSVGSEFETTSFCNLRSQNNRLTLVNNEIISEPISRKWWRSPDLCDFEILHGTSSELESATGQMRTSDLLTSKKITVLGQVDSNRLSMRRSLRKRIGEGFIKPRKPYNEQDYCEEVTYVTNENTIKKTSKTLRLKKKINSYIKFEGE